MSPNEALARKRETDRVKRMALVSVPATPLARQQRFHTQAQQLIDGILLALAFFASYSLRDVLGGRYLAEVDPYASYVPLGAFVAFAGPIVLARFGLYLPIAGNRRTLLQIVKGVGVVVLLLLGAAYVIHEQLSRVLVGTFGLGSIALVMARRFAWKRTARGAASARHTVALFGGRQQNADLQTLIDAHPAWGITIAGTLDADTTRPEALIGLLHVHHADSVIVAGARTTFDKIDEVIRVCETEGVDVWLFADFVNTLSSRMAFDEFHGQPMLRFHAKPELSWSLVVKRAIDLFVASVMLLLAGPLVMLPTAIAIRLGSKGPILFRQDRCGKHGKRFVMYKFRSMVVDAEARRAQLESLNEQSGPVFKVARDPRITRIGRFIRKMSIDELPQLFNILKGDMAIVGPRPPIPSEVEKYERWQRRRLSMKPGLTCLWQVSGRNDVGFEEWMKLDLAYIDQWSLALDFEIMLRTVPVVLVGSGY
jgi:exopolysaccharide biosynthesis polyprenyl glycosylphosphotransferase